MKTLYITNLGNSDLVNTIVTNFNSQNDHLPTVVRNEKMYQAMLQLLLLKYESDGDGFYETSLAIGGPLDQQPDAPVGAITLRIDYDPLCDDGEAAGTTPSWPPYEVFTNAIMALNAPNSHPQFPERALIYEMRVQIKVDVDTIVEHTYWATQYDLVPGLISGTI